MFFLDSSSDEEDVYDMRVVRRSFRDKSDPFSQPEKQFRKNFRLSKKAFKFVLDGLSISDGSRGTVIPPVLKLGATLYLLGSGSYQFGVGNHFFIGMAQPTISKVVNEVIGALETKLCDMWIRFTPQDFPKAKSYFFNKYNLPGVVGCIDGTHVMILKPRENEHTFVNRKGRHSINVMIICDHSYRITAINPCYGGAAHDSFVFGLSEEKNMLERRFNDGDKHSWLLGDSGYALTPWLLSPYRTPESDAGEETFNRVHSQARSVVEETIGVWKGRWRCLQDERTMRYAPEKVAAIANVCAALHNICLHFKVPLNTTDVYLARENVNRDLEESPETDLSRVAKRTRDEIKNSLLSNLNV